MYKLYHQTICPFSRKIRILLTAKNLGFELIPENFWERRKEFIAMNTMGTVPVLFDARNGDIIPCSNVIVEYLSEKHADDSANFLGNSLIQRAEVRRLQYWFDEKFFNDVSKILLNERYFGRFTRLSSPNSSNIMTCKHNLEIHLGYMEYLLSNRKYLAGNEITIADFAAAGHISAIDYFGDINWRNHNLVKDWYCLIKSNKILGKILEDKIPGIMPPNWYDKLDF